MDVIGFLAGLAADAISGSIIVNPIVIVAAIAFLVVFGSGLAAGAVDAWTDRATPALFSSAPIRAIMRRGGSTRAGRTAE